MPLDKGYFLRAAPAWHSCCSRAAQTKKASLTNKGSADDGIPVELFQILNDDAVKVLHSKCQQNWKTQQWPQNWKRSVFIAVSKKCNTKEYSNYGTIALISHASELMLKILQARLQQYVNRELPDVQKTHTEHFDSSKTCCT